MIQNIQLIDYSLSLNTIKTTEDKLKYNNLVTSFKNYSVFHSLQYFNEQIDSNKLNYFIFKEQDKVLIIMPIYINKIESSILEQDYYDAISPYGYSGPLICETCNFEHLKSFWDGVDDWYKNNNVVTEFIRFNLENNYDCYTGHLIPALKNIKGELKSFDEIWTNFKQKSRNNYRKAEKADLKINFYTDNNIAEENIKCFYNIYIKTMKRNDASNNYFFSLDYFTNLILNNSKNIILVIVTKDNKPISAELIIISKDTLYSYLGGTLAKYFNYRPNDFLKIEVMKWAINNHKKIYVLGGGRVDFDSLYQYKKSFFPKDDDLIFYTGRKIINPIIYKELIKNLNLEYSSMNLIDDKSTYFPLYKDPFSIEPPKYNIEVITSKIDWMNTLKEVESYDFYHTYDYHYLSKKTEEKAVLLKYTENNTTIALPLIIRKIKNTNYFDATSAYGYCGPLQSQVPDNYNNNHFIEALGVFLRQENIISLFNRLNPYIKHQDHVLKNMGEIKVLGDVVNIDLTKPLEESRAAYAKSTKSRVNKAKKNCEIISSSNKADIDIFIEIYYENMDRVNAKNSYYFTKKYFYDLVSSQDYKIDLLFAIHKETKVYMCAAMMVKTSDNIIQYHLSGTKNDYLNLSPIRAIIDEMRIIGTNEKYTYFNLGGGLGSEEDELFKFKSSFSKDFKSFKVWKYIVNPKIYTELVEDKNLSEKENEINFFPLYRYEVR